ncbi:Ser/Thr protein phosphatase, putative [Trichomonas vaginalis G3]|uniref:Serine/threonine-protein phosphatase n=1 Tax=Trichomonas vaginalis (strain ATCC PRA-98 / G3) TaxID=412133 RepID=A2FW26_TRIV3|nr:phosphoprotein phosphatase protein [Trichomonas vaginalis G3]EAX90897.1 Ser/Thr protein phosphatase, putative [Trichomonas vaginalis G3]KAI5504027.1 phosphoprotein phosphatase protein [Trichomonas vaginalis G3]|eukprot:XP_001303827.1 Ser/Thr protein phosphatase [Trichomonas vaginalis G3]
MIDEDFSTRLTNLLSISTSYSVNDITSFSQLRVRLKIPRIHLDILLRIIEITTDILKSEHNVMKIQSPILIVGDLHGHLLDLLRIISKHGLPPKTRYLFLGDIVDRGEFSLETLTLVFTLKILFPENVFIIRGNHEFPEMFETNGFSNEIYNTYGENKTLIEKLSNCFGYIPVAAIIDNKYLCIHGGIGQETESIEQIERLPRPIINFTNDLLNELVWSDPAPGIPLFMPSARGVGYLFGQKAAQSFLQKNNIELIIRGHQVTFEGIERTIDEVLTVFSASNYCGKNGNKSGIAIIEEGKLSTLVEQPLNYILRSQVHFYDTDLHSFETSGSINQNDLRGPSLPKLLGLSSRSLRGKNPIPLAHSTSQPNQRSNLSHHPTKKPVSLRKHSLMI